MKKMKKLPSKKAGPILCAVGIAVSLSGYFATYLGTRKSSEVLIKAWKNDHPGEEVPSNIFSKYSFKERTKLTWKEYIASGVCAVTGTSLIIGGQKNAEKRSAMIASMLQTTQRELELQKEETKNAVGEEKAKEIEEKVKKSTGKSDEQIVNSIAKNKVMIVDGLSACAMYGTYHDVEKAIDDINHTMDYTGDVYSYQEYLEELGFCDRDNSLATDIPQDAYYRVWDSKHHIDVSPEPKYNYVTGDVYIVLQHRILPSGAGY